MSNIVLSGEELETMMKSRWFKWLVQEMEIGLQFAKVTTETETNRIKIYRAQGAIEYARRAIALPELALEDYNEDREEEPDDS